MSALIRLATNPLVLVFVIVLPMLESGAAGGVINSVKNTLMEPLVTAQIPGVGAISGGGNAILR